MTRRVHRNPSARLERDDRLLRRDTAGYSRKTPWVPEALDVEQDDRRRGSFSQYSMRSLADTSALLPIETKLDIPSPS